MLAALGVLGASALLFTLIASTGVKEDVSLLQEPSLRSASYYAHLASSDSWLAGPPQLQAQQEQLKANVKARTQSLADWNSGALAGTASYVTLCARGNNAACDKLMSDPGAIHALQHIDDRNPQGFAARHPQRSLNLRQHTPAAPRRSNLRAQQQAHLRAVQQARLRAQQERMPAWLKQYRTNAETKKEWASPAWKDGALSDTLDDQWLKSCGEGNAYACKHIADNNDALHDLLHPRHKYIRSKPTIQAALAPVYVAKEQRGFLSSLMDSLGLGDSFVGNGDKEEVRPPPKMVPDQGLDNRGTRAVYNDGTVGEFSDQQ